MKKRNEQSREKRKRTKDEVVVFHLGIPDLLVHGVTRVIKVGKEAGIDKDVADLLAIVVERRGHRHNGNLARGQPEGPSRKKEKGGKRKENERLNKEEKREEVRCKKLTISRHSSR